MTTRSASSSDDASSREALRYASNLLDRPADEMERRIFGYRLVGQVPWLDGTVRIALCEALMVSPSLLLRPDLALSGGGARKSGQIRRIAAGPEPRAAPLEGEHGEDSQFNRAEHAPCCGKAGGGLVTVAWSHFERIKRRKRWLRTWCGIDRSQRCLEALARHGRPEIFNTDQGSQFTSAAFTGLLLGNAIRISMDGRGSSRGNVFVKRLWRSVKYEEVYLRAYDRVAEARGSIGGYLAFYNRKRPHSSLSGRSPDQAYFCGLALAEAA